MEELTLGGPRELGEVPPAARAAVVPHRRPPAARGGAGADGGDVRRRRQAAAPGLAVCRSEAAVGRAERLPQAHARALPRLLPPARRLHREAGHRRRSRGAGVPRLRPRLHRHHRGRAHQRLPAREGLPQVEGGARHRRRQAPRRQHVRLPRLAAHGRLLPHAVEQRHQHPGRPQSGRDAAWRRSSTRRCASA